MITRCPSCRTHFRVHPEQLSARAGQVRCGRCGRVFDALEHLAEARALPDTPSSARILTAPAPVVPETETPATAEFDFAADKTESAAQAAAQATAPRAPSVPDAVRTPLPPSEQQAAADDFDFGPGAAPQARSFVWLWAAGALLLLVLLLAQAAYYFRSTLIVLFPQVKPYATQLCANLGCDLPLPRRIELMSIEASDLQADTSNPNIMVLSATIKNRAIFDQQLPLLELTLTDAQDQPVVRRVLAPTDYIGKSTPAPAGFVANSEIAIKVFIEGSRVKATGYRLYLFFQ